MMLMIYYLKDYYQTNKKNKSALVLKLKHVSATNLIERDFPKDAHLAKGWVVGVLDE